MLMKVSDYGKTARNLYLTSQKKSTFAIFKKKLTIDPLYLGIYTPSPQVLTYRPQILCIQNGAAKSFHVAELRIRAIVLQQ